jgi:hypothetical protein
MSATGMQCMVGPAPASAPPLAADNVWYVGRSVPSRPPADHRSFSFSPPPVLIAADGYPGLGRLAPAASSPPPGARRIGAWPDAGARCSRCWQSG